MKREPRKKAWRHAHRFPDRLREGCVTRVREGWPLAEVVDWAAEEMASVWGREDGPRPNQIRGWFWRAKMKARRAAKRPQHPGEGWACSRGQDRASTEDLLTFAEFRAVRPHGIGCTLWESMAAIAMRHGWEYTKRTLCEKAVAWSKDRRVRYYIRKIQSGEKRVRSKTALEAIEKGLGLYDLESADWLGKLQLERIGVANHFVAEAAAKRLDAKYSQTPESQEQGARAVLVARLAKLLGEGEGAPVGVLGEASGGEQVKWIEAEIVHEDPENETLEGHQDGEGNNTEDRGRSDAGVSSAAEGAAVGQAGEPGHAATSDD